MQATPSVVSGAFHVCPGTVREIAVPPAARLLGAGDLEVRVDEDVIPGVRRIYVVDDPWGNRVELLA